jgi:hypothetical protein
LDAVALLYAVSAIDMPKSKLDEHMVRVYIRNQEDEDERYDQMKLETE